MRRSHTAFSYTKIKSLKSAKKDGCGRCTCRSNAVANKRTQDIELYIVFPEYDRAQPMNLLADILVHTTQVKSYGSGQANSARHHNQSLQCAQGRDSRTAYIQAAAERMQEGEQACVVVSLEAAGQQ